MPRGPLSQSYAGAVALVVLALVPFLMVTAAVVPLSEEIAKSVGMSHQALELTIALAEGAYAFGTVMAVQLAVHLHTRRLLIVYVSVFAVAAVLCAWAPSQWVFMAAFVVEGFCTSLMLIAAVPPLVTGWPVSKMPFTGAIMNMCIFGAVALGPTLGAIEASRHEWRPLFWVVAGLALLALTFSVLTYRDDPPADKSAPWDLLAVGLGGVGCAAAFVGAGRLATSSTASPSDVVPLVAGVLMIVTLVVYQYREPNPLMPVKQLATAFPVSGILTAMAASASAIGLTELLLEALQSKVSPSQLALWFLPEFGAAVLIALLFGALLPTRSTPLLSLGGLVAITAAAALTAAFAGHTSGSAVALISGLIGLGIGASVSPALFIAGFSLRSAQIQRVFALIELLRGMTAFLVAPVLAFIAASAASTEPASAVEAIYVCLAIAAGGALVATGIFLLSGGHLQVPDLKRWQEEGEPAWHSPPLFRILREETVGAAVEEGEPARKAS